MQDIISWLLIAFGALGGAVAWAANIAARRAVKEQRNVTALTRAASNRRHPPAGEFMRIIDTTAEDIYPER